MVQSVNYPGDPHRPGGSAFPSWGQLEEQQEQGCDSRVGCTPSADHPAWSHIPKWGWVRQQLLGIFGFDGVPNCLQKPPVLQHYSGCWMQGVWWLPVNPVTVLGFLSGLRVPQSSVQVVSQFLPALCCGYSKEICL